MAQSQLSWLPVHPDLGGALRAARSLEAAEDRWRAARELAGVQRDVIATNRIDRLIASPAPQPEGLAPVRLAMLGSHTTDHLVPAIRVAGLNHGLAVRVQVGAYGMYREALLGDDPELRSFAPDAVLLALDLGSVVPDLSLTADQPLVEAVLDRTTDELRALWRAVRERFGARAIQQTFIAQTPRLAGSNEWLMPASPAQLCEGLNRRLRIAAAGGEVLLLDLDGCGAAADGPLYDPARWHQAKQLVNPLLAPLHGEHVARLLAACTGKARRCLVLDLDNTVWGGVIGDDGVEGIVIGQGSASGEAFLALQQYAGLLRQRGIVLAVCSKNDADVARSAFERHPDMLLAFDDIACFVANWSDKATNLRTIATTLNLGLDSLVFVDDNPAERAVVRRELPQVAVPELPDDVSAYPATIAAAGYFEAIALTPEDFRRADDYRQTRLRTAAAEAVTDMAGFLSSLDMRLTGAPLGAFDRARAAQLVNKSNQFNLTTRRRSEAELAALAERSDSAVLTFRLRDRFGDSGLISVIAARPDEALPPDEMLIDTWLMSCRVLGRGVELAALDLLCATVRDLGARALVGEYRPSGRNGMVADHYRKLGFTPRDAPPGAEPDATFWRLDLDRPPETAHHLVLETMA